MFFLMNLPPSSMDIGQILTDNISKALSPIFNNLNNFIKENIDKAINQRLPEAISSQVYALAESVDAEARNKPKQIKWDVTADNVVFTNTDGAMLYLSLNQNKPIKKTKFYEIKKKYALNVLFNDGSNNFAKDELKRVKTYLLKHAGI